MPASCHNSAGSVVFRAAQRKRCVLFSLLFTLRLILTCISAVGETNNVEMLFSGSLKPVSLLALWGYREHCF